MYLLGLGHHTRPEPLGRQTMWWPWRARRPNPSTLDVHPPRLPDGETILCRGQSRPYSEILADPNARTASFPTVDRSNIVRPYMNAHTEDTETRRRGWWKA